MTEDNFVGTLEYFKKSNIYYYSVKSLEKLKYYEISHQNL